MNTPTNHTWDELWDCVKHHWRFTPKDPPELTLNRLFLKALGYPVLDKRSTKHPLTLTEERWPTQRLADLQPNITEDPGPVIGDLDTPILVVRYRGTDYRLDGQRYRLDGQRRIWHWSKNGDTADHAVLLLTVN